MIIMQKVFNLFSTVAFAGVVAIGAGAGYVYLNKDAIVDGIKEAAMEQVTEALPGLVGGALGGGIGGSTPIPGSGSSTGAGTGGFLPVPNAPLGL